MLLANLLDSLSLHKEKNTIGHAVIEEYKTVGWGDVALNMIIFLLVFYSSYTAAIWRWLQFLNDMYCFWFIHF